MKRLIDGVYSPEIAWDFRSDHLVVVCSDGGRYTITSDGFTKRKSEIGKLESLVIDQSRREIGLTSEGRLVRIQDNCPSFIAYDGSQVVSGIECVTVFSNGIIYFMRGQVLFYVLPEDHDPQIRRASDEFGFKTAQIAFSADERCLLMLDCKGKRMMVSDLAIDATVGGRTRVLIGLGGDSEVRSMAVNRSGNIWILCGSSLKVFSPFGKELRSFELEGEFNHITVSDSMVYLADSSSVWCLEIGRQEC